MKLQPNNGPKLSLGIGPSSDNEIGSRREFPRRLAEWIGKLVGNIKGDRREEDRRTYRKNAGGYRIMRDSTILTIRRCGASSLTRGGGRRRRKKKKKKKKKKKRTGWTRPRREKPDLEKRSGGGRARRLWRRRARLCRRRRGKATNRAG
ncbi:hypothetical protein B296_00002718, partial [Ensete ventricosum]